MQNLILKAICWTRLEFFRDISIILVTVWIIGAAAFLTLPLVI